MRLTPRSEEVKAVVALLESEDFDSAEQLAKAVVKEVAELLWNRDWLALSHRFDGATRGINFGPFAMEADARKFAETLAPGGRFAVVPLRSPGQVLGAIEGNPKVRGLCSDPACGHATWTHAIEGSSRGHCYLSDGPCPCKKFRK